MEKKHYIHSIMYALVAVVMACMPLTSDAQELKTQNDSVKHMRMLRKDLIAKQKLHDGLPTKIQAVVDDTVKLAGSEEYKKYLKLMTEIENLRKQKTTITGDIKRKLDAMRQQCDGRATNAATRHSNDSLRISQMKARINELNLQRSNVEQGLVNAVSEWERMLFSETDIAQLQQACNKYSYYKDNAQVAAAGKRMSELVAQQTVYNQLKSCVENEYNSAEFFNLMNKAKQMLPTISNAGRKQELSAALRTAGNYPDAVKKFKSIVAELNVDNLDTGALGILKAMLKSKQADIDAINQIPWLSGQWKAFYDAVENRNLDKVKTVSERIRDLK